VPTAGGGHAPTGRVTERRPIDPAARAPRRITRALRSRNFRLFFGGQSISLVGTWITRIATSWLVYRLTGSVLLLGLVGFCGQIPTLLLSPFAGVLVDRMDRHRILVITQVLSLLQSAGLAVLTLAGRITVLDILVLQVAQGIINAFDTPARQAFVVQMVEDRADLPNAIALNSSMVNASRIIGPSIGGIVIAAVGEGWCFALDAVSYLAVIASLLAMQLVPRLLPPRDTRMRDELRTGFEYIWRFLPVRWALLLLSLVSVMGMPYSVLMPAIATRVLHGGPHTLGFLMTASGVGALAGALYLASRRSVLGLARLMVAASACFGVGLVALGLSTTLWVALAVLPLVGAGMMITLAAANTIIQTVVSEELRGRVMSFFTMAFLGSAPIGSLLAGVAADRIGAQRTIVIGGVACLAGAAWFRWRLPHFRRLVRPVYLERGILVAVESEGELRAL
jgi:MFS family permease